MKTVRCAIYTRKSSEEGLEQDFNSLDAQREACAAYVLSQASEGWQLIPDHYDDGGISGGTLERPALKRLLADVADGKIDIVVVYKVDRLTRSLLDFAKLVDVLDKAETSFVSITQSFNTTTSMGRLTLNMLLSFAQFEREVTAERIRDKIAASKAKGMWMGGTPPLGYKPDGRSLAIADEHAAIVREIYDRYLKLGNVRRLAEQLAVEGIRAPRRQRRSGDTFGGVAFSRGQLHAILKNPIYAGQIAHKDKVYKGQHEAIISQETWEEVQQRLAKHVQGTRTHRAATNALLAGKIVDAQGEPLISAHACKGTVRYRYYVSRAAHHQGGSDGTRLPAREIEGLVIQRVAALLGDPIKLIAQLQLEVTPSRIAALRQRCAELTHDGSHKRDLVHVVRQIRVAEQQVEVDIDTAVVAQELGVPRLANAPSTLSLIEHVRLTRTGRVLRLIDQDGHAPSCASVPEESLIKLVLTARRWWQALAGSSLNIKALAKQEGVTASWMTRVLRLAFLSPAVVEAIITGNLKAGISGSALLAPDGIPACWQEQASRFLPPNL